MGVKILCVFCALCVIMSSGFCQTTQPSTAPSTQPTVIEIDAISLRAAYKANGVAANQIYGGKLLSVRGHVKKTRVDPRGDDVVALFGDGKAIAVDCVFPKDADSGTVAMIRSLTLGEKVAVIGRASGMINASVRLVSQSIEQDNSGP